jgi:hypothetical protein
MKRQLSLSVFDSLVRTRVCGRCERYRQMAGRCGLESKCPVWKASGALWQVLALRDEMLGDREREMQAVVTDLVQSRQGTRDQSLRKSGRRLGKLVRELGRVY